VRRALKQENTYRSPKESTMQVHGICLLKDQADIIGETLTAARSHFDHIYVYDNGSTDGSWEIVAGIAGRSGGQVVAQQRAASDGPFRDDIRGEVFARFRSDSEPGDWWGKFDPDEFFIDDPRDFLRQVPDEYSCVWRSYYQYYFTDADRLRFLANPELYADSVPIQTRIRYYLNNWSEIGFVRHTKGILWDRRVQWPYRLGKIYPQRLRIKHFQYRSPQQISRRLAMHSGSLAQGGFATERIWDREAWETYILRRPKATIESSAGASRPVEENAHRQDWESRVLKAADLYYDNHDGQFVAREDLVPPLMNRGIRSVLPARLLKFLHNAYFCYRAALRRVKNPKLQQQGA
jgi:hypothetical protein